MATVNPLSFDAGRVIPLTPKPETVTCAQCDLPFTTRPFGAVYLTADTLEWLCSSCYNPKLDNAFPVPVDDALWVVGG